MSTLAKAIAIASSAHVDQLDKSGAPYILHPIRMMMRLHREPERMAAILHDVVEDTDWTLDRLRAEGFPDDVVAAVDCLTRRPHESYSEFIDRAAANPIARPVKLADLEDNMDLRRVSAITEKTVERVRKYHEAWLKLSRMDS